MSSPSTPRLQPFIVPGGLRGTLATLPVPDLLRELQLSEAKGILSLTSDRVRKALFFNDGKVVCGTSNVSSDRLGEVLLAEGKITLEQNDLSLRALSKGKRQGRVLVEMGALSPDDLWTGVQSQVQEIVLGVFKWGEGQFHFEESPLPERERITVDLDVTALVLEGLRRLDAGGWVRVRHPDGHLVLEPGPTSAEGLLHPFEEHVLRLIDGERSVIEVCHESEVGDNQTLKLLYAFLVTGIARSKGRKVQTLDQDFVPADSTYSVLESFNQMYRFIFTYMVKEVGPIAGKRAREVPWNGAGDPPRSSRGRGATLGRRGGRRDRREERGPSSGRGETRAARRRAQRAPVRRAARGQTHPGRRARGDDHPSPSPPVTTAMTPTPSQVRGAVMILTLVLVTLLWRLCSLP